MAVGLIDAASPAAGVLERWNDADAAAIRQAIGDYLWLVSRYETP